MAKKKRTPEVVTSTVGALIGDGYSELEGLKDELQEWYDNLPESFQNGSKGEQLQEAIGYLENLIEPSIPGDHDGIAASYTASTKRKKSRADRRDDAVQMLAGAQSALQAFLDENEEHEDADEIQSLIEDLENAISDAENVEFPGMFG